MYKLKFDENVCATCPTADCLVKCQYIQLDKEQAHKEMMKIVKGEDSFVLQDCATCYACEEYCTRGNHPFYLITERREEKGILTAARPITNQWVNMNEFQGKALSGAIKDKAMCCCGIPELLDMGSKGKIFEDIAGAFTIGAEYFCQVVYLHFAKTSVIKDRLPKVIENFKKLGVKELICLHDECYGSYTSLAPAYGMEVPFKPIHYLEYLYNRMQDLKNEIKPLNVKVAYQRPCSSRLCPETHHFAADIFKLIGVEVPDRTYVDENALCCGETIRMVTNSYETAEDVQKRNIDDMLQCGAEYTVFDCPFCQMALSEKVTKSGLKPIHIIDLCKMAIGE